MDKNAADTLGIGGAIYQLRSIYQKGRSSVAFTTGGTGAAG